MRASRKLRARLKAGVACCVTAATLAAGASPGAAQDGSAAARLGGAALGLYSGSLLGLAGGSVLCVQTPRTRTCSRLALAGGGAIGGVAGALIGDADSGSVDDALWAAGYGALAGAAVGVVVRELVYYYDWVDVAALAALGSAVGPVAPEAALGLAAGAALGIGLHLVVPSFELTDALAFGLAGVAIGGLTAWTLKAADARDARGRSEPDLMIELLTVRF